MIKLKKIFVVKNVHLQKCIKDVFVSCQEIDAEINFLPRDVNFVVAQDATPKKNPRGLHLALPDRNPSKAKAYNVYTIRWKTI